MIIQDNSYEHDATIEQARSQPMQTTASASGGTNTRVAANFEIEATSTNVVGIFTIQMMPQADPVYAAASIDAQVFVTTNEHLIKRK